MENLTSEELANLQKVVQQFNQAKMQLGETVIAQENLLASVKEIKVAYSEIEKSLMETYGADALINIETGEISKEEKKFAKYCCNCTACLCYKYCCVSGRFIRRKPV